MLSASDELAEVVQAGGFDCSYIADVVVDGETVLEGVPLVSAQLDWNAERQVFAQGTCVLAYSDEEGRTVVPDTIADWLTPYATSLVISMVVTTRSGFSETILRGVLRITGVGDPQERWVTVNGTPVALGSSVRLRLADEFDRVASEPFPVPTAPASTDSTWAEIQRLTGLAVRREVDDVAIPRDLAYDLSRIETVFGLGRLLGGRPYVTAPGSVAILTDEWPAESPPIVVGETGRVVPADPAEWTANGIYNEIVVLSHDDSQQGVLGRARIAEGPLRYGGPFGRRPKIVRDDQVTTEAGAVALAERLLPNFSTRPSRRFTIQTLPDPRREVGDVVPFTRENGKEHVGRIVDLVLAAPGVMTVLVEVPSE